MLAKKMGDVAKKYKAPDVEHYAAELVGEFFKCRLVLQGYRYAAVKYWIALSKGSIGSSFKQTK